MYRRLMVIVSISIIILFYLIGCNTIKESVANNPQVSDIKIISQSLIPQNNEIEEEYHEFYEGETFYLPNYYDKFQLYGDYIYFGGINNNILGLYRKKLSGESETELVINTNLIVENIDYFTNYIELYISNEELVFIHHNTGLLTYAIAPSVFIIDCNYNINFLFNGWQQFAFDKEYVAYFDDEILIIKNRINNNQENIILTSILSVKSIMLQNNDIYYIASTVNDNNTYHLYRYNTITRNNDLYFNLSINPASNLEIIDGDILVTVLDINENTSKKALYGIDIKNSLYYVNKNGSYKKIVDHVDNFWIDELNIYYTNLHLNEKLNSAYYNYAGLRKTDVDKNYDHSVLAKSKSFFLQGIPIFSNTHIIIPVTINSKILSSSLTSPNSILIVNKISNNEYLVNCPLKEYEYLNISINEYYIAYESMKKILILDKNIFY